MEKELWFKTKRVGWGWTPNSPSGWITFLTYLVTNVFYFLYVDKDSHSASDTLINFSPIFIVTTIILIWVCYKKGEKPKWKGL